MIALAKCSVCGTEVMEGAQQRCGGLQLAAYAVAVPKLRKRGWSAFTWILILGFGVIALAVFSSWQTQRDSAADKTREDAEHQKEGALSKALDAIATPAAFMAKCGKAQRQTVENGHPTLLYGLGNGELMHVTLIRETKWSIVAFASTLHGKRYLLSHEEGLSEIGCKLQ